MCSPFIPTWIGNPKNTSVLRTYKRACNKINAVFKTTEYQAMDFNSIKNKICNALQRKQPSNVR